MKRTHVLATVAVVSILCTVASAAQARVDMSRTLYWTGTFTLSVDLTRTNDKGGTTHWQGTVTAEVAGTQGWIRSSTFRQEDSFPAAASGACTEVRRVTTGAGSARSGSTSERLEQFDNGGSLLSIAVGAAGLHVDVEHDSKGAPPCAASVMTSGVIPFGAAADVYLPLVAPSATTLKGTAQLGLRALRGATLGHALYAGESGSASITYDLALGEQRSLMPVASGLTGRVAFVQGAPPCPMQCTQRLMTMNADGTALKMLTKGFQDAGPRWSPDGKRLLFTRTPSRVGCCEIWVMNRDGTGAHKLATGYTAWGEVHPTWSHDGKTILFENQLSIVRGHVGHDLDGTTIDAVTATGRPVVRKLFRLAGAWLHPRVSPQGSRLAMDTGQSIWTMTLAGKDRRKVLDGHVAWPSWSPDGKQLAWAGVPPDGNAAVLGIADAAGGRSTPLWSSASLDYPPADMLHENEPSPVWSGDGRYLLYSGLNPFYDATELHVIDIATQAIEMLPGQVPVLGCHGPVGGAVQHCNAFDPDWFGSS